MVTMSHRSIAVRNPQAGGTVGCPRRSPRRNSSSTFSGHPRSMLSNSSITATVTAGTGGSGSGAFAFGRYAARRTVRPDGGVHSGSPARRWPTGRC